MKILKKIVVRVTKPLGFEVCRHIADRDECCHESVRPNATYSPWKKDGDFLRMLDRIQGKTLVDHYRCWELWKLVEQSAKLSEGDLLEVGVWRGGTGALLAAQAKRCNITGRVFLCDTFSGVVKATEKDADYSGGEHADTSEKGVRDFIENELGLENVTILKGIFPDQTGITIGESKFRFCHIDVDVYQSAKDVVDFIWRRLVIGGMVCFDDFGFSSCGGIAQYVEESMSEPDRLVFHNLNGHAVIVKIK